MSLEPSDQKQYRNPEKVKELKSKIDEITNRLGPVRLMHLCGTHEFAINKFALRQLLPKDLVIVPGPGCPVCVCPVEDVDKAVTLAMQEKVTILSFGDMLRVPGTRTSLEKVRKQGGQVRVIYSPVDAIAIAKESPSESFVFFSVGFETTAAGVASLIRQDLPENLYFLIANRYMPPVLNLLMEIHDETIQGFLLPGHACIITGKPAYQFMETRYKLPCAITGFEPVDVLVGILDLLRQIEAGTFRVTNRYPRAVLDQGNLTAQKILDEVFDLKPGIWRGIDRIDGSAYVLKSKFDALNAEVRFDCDPGYPPRPHPPGCQCHRIMLGELLPSDCSLFKKSCHPQDPFGPCMVSTEGTCYNWYHFGSS